LGAFGERGFNFDEFKPGELQKKQAVATWNSLEDLLEDRGWPVAGPSDCTVTDF
jgi:hypothetical protein